MIEIERVPQKTDNFVVAKVDGEPVIMQIENGFFFTLNSTAEDIWNSINNEASIEDIIQSMAKSYDVQAAECSDDIQGFLKDLADNDLVRFA